MEYYRPVLIEDKSNEELKKGIIQALRMLMTNFNSLAESENEIRKIQLSKFLLDDKKDSVYSEVYQLEEITKWKLRELFEDCISYPEKSIYPNKYYSREVREKSICEVCNEYVVDITNRELKICTSCLDKCHDTIENKSVLEDCILFKTPEEEYWCGHANQNTLMLSTDKYYIGGGLIICEKCITEEKSKRK